MRSDNERRESAVMQNKLQVAMLHDVTAYKHAASAKLLFLFISM